MNKKELVAATAEASGMPKKCVELVLKALTANVIAEVAKKGQSSADRFRYVRSPCARCPYRQESADRQAH